MLRRQVIGGAMIVGIIGGIGIDLWMQNNPSTVVYAQEPEEKEIQVAVVIDWTPERIEQEVRSVFHEQPDLAIAVAKSESGAGLNPDAYNPEWHYDRHGNKVCQGSYGLMQIACVHMMHNPEALFDIKTNLEIGRRLYEEQGWKPWGGYTSGGYKKHI